MKTEDSILQNWDDLVFESRNKEYGAYGIRKSYPKNMLEGLMACMFFGALILLYAHLASLFTDRSMTLIKEGPGIILDPPPIINPIEKIIKEIKPPAKEKNTAVVPVVTSQVVEEVDVLNHSEARGAESGNMSGEGTPIAGKGAGAMGEVLAAVRPVPTVDIAEVMPAYYGGIEAMMKFVQKKMKYPRLSRENGIEGSVYVQFVVNYEGRVVEVKVVRGISADCDSEAARVIAMMPAWKPGMQGKMPVSVRMVLPIKFKLENH